MVAPVSFRLVRARCWWGVFALVVGCGDASNAARDGALVVDSAAVLDASALDASDERADELCPGVRAGFACEGDTWALCDLGEAWRVDCRMPPRGASPGRCAQVSPEDGYACVVPIGGGCRMEIAHGTHSHVFITACEGRDSGCLVSERGAGFEGTCAGDLGACSVDDVGVCRGQRLVTRCLRAQPVAMDCAALGGRCGPGECFALPEGAPCGTTLRCRDGLRCRRASRRELFRCAADEGEDGGSS